MTADHPLLRPSNASGKRISFALAAIIHLALAAFLFYGVRWQTKATDIVDVDLVSSIPVQIAVPPALEMEPPAPAEIKQEAKPAKPALPPPRPEIAIKEKEIKPPADSKPRIDPFQEQLKLEAEKLTARKVEDSAAQELAKIKASQEAKAAAAKSKEIANYIGRIISAIRPRIALPPDLKGNPEAVFLVTQLPSGEILSVVIKRSSGNATLDANIERAILKSSPLPKPEQSDLFSRELNLTFRPLDN